MTTKERTVAGIALLLVAALGVALIVAGATQSKPRLVPVPYHVAALTVDLERARLRCDMLEVIAAEKWVTTTGKVCRCGLCGGKWQAGKKANHGERCVLATPEWRAR
jgi:hypothetical protein